MDAIKNSREIFIDETERKPNLYAANLLAGVVGVIAIVCALNEVGIFEVNKALVRICFIVSLLQFLAMRFVVRDPGRLTHYATKYYMMGMVLFLVLTVTVLLNIHAVLGFVLPILLATQYRSRSLSCMALAGSCLCCLIAPIVAYFWDTWNLVFLTGYIQTFCRVTIDITKGNDIGVLEAIKQITLYWSMPQVLTLGSFGIILFSVTKSGIESVENQIRVVDLSVALSARIESIQSMQEKILFSMSDIIENRDLETGGHVRRTSEIVRLIMDAMRRDPHCEISDSFYHDVIKTAPMHDLGKIAIPDAILRKPGKLTSEEYEIVKKHPIKSAEIIVQALTGIEDAQLLVTAVNIAKYHHEKIDGTGYPEQLKGKDIPLEARIMAIADAYDALVSERCYQASVDFNEAFEIIEEAMGTQFDPELNRYFISCRDEIEKFYRE